MLWLCRKIFQRVAHQWFFFFSSRRRHTRLQGDWSSDVCSSDLGFTGAGAKTVIPAKAVAKVSMRLVPKQDPEKILAAYKKFVRENTPLGVEMEVRDRKSVV